MTTQTESVNEPPAALHLEDSPQQPPRSVQFRYSESARVYEVGIGPPKANLQVDALALAFVPVKAIFDSRAGSSHVTTHKAHLVSECANLPDSRLGILSALDAQRRQRSPDSP